MKSFIGCLVLVIMSTGAWAQGDTAFYYMDENRAATDSINAVYRRFYWADDIVYTVKDYYTVTGNLYKTGQYLDSALSIKTGMFESFGLNKSLTAKGAYVNNKKAGLWKLYHSNGLISDSTFYRNDTIIKFSYKWNEKGVMVDSTIVDKTGAGYQVRFYPDKAIKSHGKICYGDLHDSLWIYYYQNGKRKAFIDWQCGSAGKVETFDSSGMKSSLHFTGIQYPIFPGGKEKLNEYLARIDYPYRARANNITGRVIVSFMVNEDGSISEIELLKGIGRDCDEEALKIVRKMPKWSPMIIMSEPVKTACTLPIKFSLK